MRSSDLGGGARFRIDAIKQPRPRTILQATTSHGTGRRRPPVAQMFWCCSRCLTVGATKSRCVGVHNARASMRKQFGVLPIVCETANGKMGACSNMSWHAWRPSGILWRTGTLLIVAIFISWHIWAREGG